MGVLAFFGLVLIIAEIRRAVLGQDFWFFYADFWGEFWFYMSYVVPFI